MTITSRHTNVISHIGHWYTIRECQMMVTTKSVDLSLFYMKPWLRSFMVN